MSAYKEDLQTLRPLAERYSAIAALDIQKERMERYSRTISLEEVRPVVLVDEVPWGELPDEELRLRCKHEELHAVEQRLRRLLYQWDHFQADLVIPPVFEVAKRVRSTGIGITVQDTQIKAASGSYAASHRYVDQLATDDDLEKLKLPVLSYDRESTEKAFELASEVFAGLMPVEIRGTTFGFNIWDLIAEFRGVDNLLMDLAARPEFMHRTAEKFMEIGAATARQLEELDLLESSRLLVHCTPALTTDLPAADFAGKVRLKDSWGRAAAQIFAAVSPEMHDEFDLVYSQQLFGGFGLLYYGCCEPMDRKVDILRRRFKNLRKISITPWADPEVAAANIGKDYVLAAKPNPAFVAPATFNPIPVEKEINRYLEVCKRYGTTCEFVLKDISTISAKVENLTEWVATVDRVIDRYY